MAIDPSSMRPGDIVLLAPCDDIPAHAFHVHDIVEDCVSGYSLSGPLAGDYGEPDLSMIAAILHRDAPQG